MATYYSQGTGNFSTLANWNTVAGGGGSAPASVAAMNSQTMVIQAGHTVTFDIEDAPAVDGSVSGWATGVTLRIEGAAAGHELRGHFRRHQRRRRRGSDTILHRTGREWHLQCLGTVRRYACEEHRDCACASELVGHRSSRGVAPGERAAVVWRDAGTGVGR